MDFDENNTRHGEEGDFDDYKTYPLQHPKIQWQDLNQDFTSKIRNYREITELAQQHKDKLLDLRPYMIENPYTVSVRDKMPKVLNVFR